MALSFEGLNSTHLSRVTCVYDWKYAIEHFVVLRQFFFCGFKRHENLPDWSFSLFFSAIVKVVRALGSLCNWTWLARFETLWQTCWVPPAPNPTLVGKSGTNKKEIRNMIWASWKFNWVKHKSAKCTFRNFDFLFNQISHPWEFLTYNLKKWNSLSRPFPLNLVHRWEEGWWLVILNVFSNF